MHSLLHSCSMCAFIFQMTLSSHPISEPACSPGLTKAYVYALVFLLYKVFSSSFPERSSVYKISFHAEPLMLHKSPIFHFLDTPSSLTFSFWVFQGLVPPRGRSLACSSQPRVHLHCPTTVPLLLYKSPDYYIIETKLSYSERRL